MKEIMAIIRPSRYFATKHRLIGHVFSAMSTKEVLGRGRKKVVFHTEGEEEREVVGIEFVAKRLIEMVERDEDVETVIGLLLEDNSTGHPGDGKIFVLPVENALRVRTGEQGDDVLV